MADAQETGADAPRKASRRPLVLGLALAVMLGGGGFFAIYSGMIPGKAASGAADAHGPVQAGPLADVAFIALDPLVINLGTGSSSRHLKFRAQLEVDPPYEAEVTTLLPRVLDVLNGYLRAVDVTDLEERSALIRLRAQMLRRVQMVTGEGRVRDLLIAEFVLN